MILEDLINKFFNKYFIINNLYIITNNNIFKYNNLIEIKVQFIMYN